MKTDLLQWPRRSWSIMLCQWWILLVAATLSPSVEGRDLHLTDGRVFHSIEVLRVDSTALKVSHSGGVASVPVTSLSRADYLELGVAKAIEVIAPSVASNRMAQDTRSFGNAPSNSGFIGSSGWKTPPTKGGSVYVSGYTRKDGTYVRPHTRRR